MGNDKYSAIDRVVRAASSGELCQGLKECLAVLNSWSLKKGLFAEQLKKAIGEQARRYKYGAPAVRVLGQPVPNLYIYQDLEASFVYSAFKINACTTVEEVMDQIDDIVDLFENRMSRPRTGRLNAFEAVELLEAAQEKYNFLNSITGSKELEIYLLNKSHFCYNSFLLTYRNTRTGKQTGKRMLFSLSPVSELLVCNKYFVFLHELGHVLYNDIEDRGARGPFLFYELAKLMGFSSLMDEDGIQELFADVFSAATLHGTRYSEFNPYKGLLTGEIMGLLALYFKMLADRIDPGNLGWGEGKAVLH